MAAIQQNLDSKWSHTLYSPDLAPSDYYVFQRMEKQLSGLPQMMMSLMLWATPRGLKTFVSAQKGSIYSMTIGLNMLMLEGMMLKIKCLFF